MSGMEKNFQSAYDSYCATLLSGNGAYPSCIPVVDADGTHGVFSTAYQIEGFHSMEQIAAHFSEEDFHRILIAGMMAQREAVRNLGGLPLEEATVDGD